MESQAVSDLMSAIKAGSLTFQSVHRDASIVREFFDGKIALYEDFLVQVTGKSCLDIGPCIATPLTQWTHVGPRYVIEPLASQVVDWQQRRFSFSVCDGLSVYTEPAEKEYPELLKQIDGVIFCRNCLDHSPNWPFILANIGKYAASGCYLLLWSDLDHGRAADNGHFNITDDPAHMKSPVEALGFEVQSQYSDMSRESMNWGCLARKT